MSKLAELVYEYNESPRRWYRLWLTTKITDNSNWAELPVDKDAEIRKFDLSIISKKYWFIEWAIEQEKIFVPAWIWKSPFVDDNTPDRMADRLIMHLSILDNPLNELESMVRDWTEKVIALLDEYEWWDTIEHWYINWEIKRRVKWQNLKTWDEHYPRSDVIWYCRKFWFAKWLCTNNMIDKDKLHEEVECRWMVKYITNWDDELLLLMLLSIMNDPVKFLVRVLN